MLSLSKHGPITMHIRKAQSGEAKSITALAQRSKAHWDYTPEFLARVSPLLTITEEDIRKRRIFVANEDGKAIAFYAFGEIDGDVFLTDMFVDPAAIGSGLGRHLWNHAIEQAREMKIASFLIESDPNAEAFYLKMGAVRLGTIHSASGRDLPLLKYAVPPLSY